MTYSVRLVQVESHGDREVIVLDKDGLPPLDINMYITRFRDCAHTYRVKLARSIVKIYMWAEAQQIDLIERMKSGEFFTFIEMEALKEYLRYRVDAPTHSPQSVEIAHKTFVNFDTYRKRANHIVSYLEFHGNVFAGTRKRSDPYAKEMRAFIAQLRQILIERGGLTYSKQRYGLKDEQLTKLLWWMDPNNPQNPFQDRVKLRNQLIVYILLLTGVREGELLSMRPDALVKKPYGYALRVTQNSTLDLDPRMEPPQVKTYARDIPVSDKIAQMIDTYISSERKLRGKAAAKAAPYLILNSNKQPRPMTYRGIYHICERLRKLDPDMFKELLPYQFRHTFNDMFVLISGLDVNSEEFKNMQRELGGWSQDSEQGKNYTKRAREILAAEYLKKMSSRFNL